jgi:hypothetical protein
VVDDVALRLHVLSVLDLDREAVAERETSAFFTVATFRPPASISILSRMLSFFSWIFATSRPLASSSTHESRTRIALPSTLNAFAPVSSSIQ